MALKKKKISVITPCFNEEANVRECHLKLREVFENQLPGYDYEHIFCDNCSQDGTLKILREIACQDVRVKVIVYSRNFGVFNSMFNGMLSATGDAVIPFLPADLQDPIEMIPEFVKHWQQGYEVVYGQRRNRKEPSLVSAARRLYYRCVSCFANIVIPVDVGEFSLIDKKVNDVLRQCENYSPYLRGMIADCGFRSMVVPYAMKARQRGVAKGNLWAMVDTGLNGLVSFSNVPMRLCMAAGFLIAAAAMAYAAIAFVSPVIWFHGIVLPKTPAWTMPLFFLSGLNLFFIGVLGEYISAIHFQVRKRPRVIERERINF